MTTKSIPGDFPCGGATTSLSGIHPKLAVRRDDTTGLYVTGPNDVELRERYDICVDLVDQLVAKCSRNRQTKYVAMSEQAILSGLFNKLKKSGWGTPHEMAWIIRHTAYELEWPLLEDAERLLIPQHGRPSHA